MEEPVAASLGEDMVGGEAGREGGNRKGEYGREGGGKLVKGSEWRERPREGAREGGSGSKGRREGLKEGGKEWDMQSTRGQ